MGDKDELMKCENLSTIRWITVTELKRSSVCLKWKYETLSFGIVIGVFPIWVISEIKKTQHLKLWHLTALG